MSFLISSHNLKELENICDRIGIINKGTTTIELGLDEIQDDYHKLQLAFRPDTPEVDILSGLKILHREKYGSTQQIIAEGSIPEITETINRGEPVIFDIMPLSLEEFFIYILGGEGNEYEVEQLVF